MTILVLLLILNLALSTWNAYVCGKAWVETKAAGGWNRFMVWIGAIMASCGFTWCYLILGAFGAHSAGFINGYWTGIALQTGYVIVVPIILFAGYAILIDSWARAFREGGVLNYGVAAYNTYANLHNTASAISSFGEAFGNVLEAFSGKGGSSSDDDNGGALGALVVLVIVGASLGLGVLTTTLIIKKVSAGDRLRTKEEMLSAINSKR